MSAACDFNGIVTSSDWPWLEVLARVYPRRKRRSPLDQDAGGKCRDLFAVQRPPNRVRRTVVVLL